MDARLICVIGGGIAGLAFAALHRRRGGKVLVLEREDIAAAAEDGKSVMLNVASVKLLTAAGVESKTMAPLRRLAVGFGNVPGGIEIDSGLLGYGVPHRALRQRLAAELGDDFYAATTVTAVMPQTQEVTVKYTTAAGTAHSVAAAAAVIAGNLPNLPPPFVAQSWDCRQALISFAAAAHNWPKDFAVESFNRHGIIALVPRPDSNKPVGIIICAEEAAAGKLSALADGELLQCVNDVFGGRFGLHSPTARFTYAPQIRHVSPLAAARIACLGAGATVLHPAGAQGLNMGLADAACLTETLADNAAVPAALAAYCRRRTVAHRALLVTTGMLAAGGHLRQWPFRLAGGVAASAVAAALFPWRRQAVGCLSGQYGG